MNEAPEPTVEECDYQCGKPHCWSIHEREFKESLDHLAKQMVQHQRFYDRAFRDQKDDK